MEPIHIQFLICKGEDYKKIGDFISMTTYDLVGQGHTRKEAKKSC